MIQHSQEASQEEIDRVLARLQQKGIGTSNKPVLQVNIDAMVKAKNNGYPKHMYHSTLAARVAVNEEQESMLVAQGYGPTYREQKFPKYLFRRNMNAAFDPQQRPDLNADQLAGMNPFVEEKHVMTAAAEDALRKQKPPKGCGPWYNSIALLDPLPNEYGQEDAAQEVARLNGQIEELRRQVEFKQQVATVEKEEAKAESSKVAEAPKQVEQPKPIVAGNIAKGAPRPITPPMHPSQEQKG